jgi:hypothetical protein
VEEFIEEELQKRIENFCMKDFLKGEFPCEKNERERICKKKFAQPEYLITPISDCT